MALRKKAAHLVEKVRHIKQIERVLQGALSYSFTLLLIIQTDGYSGQEYLQDAVCL